MAYIVEQVTGKNGTDPATSPSWDAWFAAQQTGDYFLVWVVHDNTTAITIPGTWTRVEGSAPSSVSGIQGEFIYIKHTGSDITEPSFTGASDDWAMIALQIRDADGTNFIDAWAITDQSASTITPEFPSVITTTPGGLIIRAATYDNTLTQGNYAGDMLNFVPEVDDHLAYNASCCAFGGYNYQELAGPTGTVPCLVSWADGGRLATIVIKNASGGGLSAGVIAPSTSPFTDIINFNKNISTLAFNDISTIRTTFAGTAVNAYTSLSIGNKNKSQTEFPKIGLGGPRVSIAGTPGWFGYYLNITSTDLSNKFLIFTASFFLAATQYSIGGPGIYFEDGAGNWVLWRPSSRAEAQIFQTYCAKMPNETFADFGGTIDWSNIVRFGACGKLDQTYTSARDVFIPVLATWDPTQRYKIVGGSSKNPATMRDANRIYMHGLWSGLTDSFGPAANANAFGFDIGDGGTTPTYFKATGQNSFVPRKDEIDKIRLQGSDFIINIKIGASDTCDLSGMPLLSTAGYQQTLSFDAATNTSGTYVTSTITDYYDWICKTGIPIVGASVNHANTIDAKGAAWNSCTITNPLAGASEAAIKFDANSSMDGTSIDLTDSAAGYHIELGASVAAFTLTDVTLSGTPGTDKIHVLATTGTVTITKIGSTTLVAADVTSEGATIAVVAPAVSLTVKVPNIIDGSSYQIKNTTTDTILTYGTTSGGTGIDQTYTLGTDYSDGDNIRVRISWHSGTSAKEQIEYNVTAGASTETNNNPITQVDASIYNTYATDNSLDSATLDSGNGGPLGWNNGTMDIEIDDPDNMMPGQDFAAWYYYYITTEDGIENVFGAIDWIAINKWINRTAIQPIEIFNTDPLNPLKITGCYIDRDDGQNIIAPGVLHSIQINPPEVHQSTPGQEVIDAFWYKEL